MMHGMQSFLLGHVASGRCRSDTGAWMKACMVLFRSSMPLLHYGQPFVLAEAPRGILARSRCCHSVV